MKIKEKNITLYTIIAPIIGVIFITSLVTYFFIQDLKEHMIYDLDKKKSISIWNKKEQIKSEVHDVTDYINYYIGSVDTRLKNSIKKRVYEAEDIVLKIYHENREKKSLSEIKEIGIDYINKLRYNNQKGYYFLYDKDSKISLSHPVKKFVGKDMSSFRDAKGEVLVEKYSMVLEKNDGEGFATIYFVKPTDNTNKQYKKIVFIKYIKELNWIIGTGEYLNDVESEVREELLKRVSQMKYGEDSYFTIHNYDGEVISHPNSELLYKNSMELTSKDGVRIVQELTEVAKSDDREFLQYKWKKPSTQEVVDKLSYATAIPNWQWVISSGLYLDDLQKSIDEERKEYVKEIERAKERFIYIGLFSMVISILFSLIVSFSIRYALKKYKVEVRYKENELAELNVALEKRIKEEVAKGRKKDQLLLQQSKLAIMGEMLSMIAHQWRQPLNAIGLIVQNIQEDYEYGELTKEQLDSQVERTLGHLHIMSKTINDFSNFFKPQNKKKLIYPKLLLENALVIAQSKLTKFNVTISQKCTFKDPVAVYEQELVQVILNIINNAVEQFEEKNCLSGTIHISTFVEKESFYIEISDNAGGIAEENFEKIFEPYFSTKSKNGTGLGLYMAKMVVELHMGGALTFKNIENGAKFIISVPFISKGIYETSNMA